MRKYFGLALFALIIASFFLSFKKQQAQKFYYAFDKKIFLTDNTQKLVVTFDTGYNNNEFDPLISSIGQSTKKSIIGKSLIIETSSSSDKQELLNTFNLNQRVRQVTTMYKDSNNFEFGFTDEILVKFKTGVTQKAKDSILEKYDLQKISTSSLFDKFSIRKGKEDVLEIANKIQESGLALFSHPNLIFERIYCNYIPNDPYFGKQFYLYNTGQVINDGRSGTAGADIKVTNAWDITKGSSSITIAVLDMGVTSNHSDLPNTRQVRLPGSNFYGTDPNDPSPNNPAIDIHGNASAGIIGATQDNNEGISGIAPNCKIMPVNTGGLDVTFVDAAKLSGAIEFARANGADIIYNGWSTTGTSPNQVPAIVTAISNATSTGRGGKGCVVICIPTNNANRSAGNTGYTSFPANVEINGVLSVGASDRYDKVANYSPGCRWFPYGSGDYPMFGQLIDVVAPSHKAYTSQIPGESAEVWTIDIPGNSGLNPYPADSRFENPPASGETLPNSSSNFLSYSGRFGGTSAAGPQVAGIAALILSINPNLTQQQVFDIIKNTADKVGGYDYSFYVNDDNNSYSPDPGRSREMGYGRLNACNAITDALKTISLTINGDNIVCSVSNNYSITGLPAGAKIVWTITPASGIAALSQSNNQATLTKISSGMVTLSAKVSESCNAIISKTIAVGVPQASNITLWNSTSSTIIGNPVGFVAGYPPNDRCQIQATDWQVSMSASVNTGNFPCEPDNGTSKNIFFQSTGTAYVQARIQNTCGWSDWSAAVPIQVGYSFMISPNPASNTITVKQGDKTKAEITEIRIFDNSGNLKKQSRYNRGTNQAQLNVSDLKVGIYFIEISSDKNTERQQVLIQK